MLAKWVFVGPVAVLLAPNLAVIVFVPPLFPAAQKLGIHSLQFGSVLVIVMEIGLFAPPLGVRFYTACAVDGRR